MGDLETLSLIRHAYMLCFSVARLFHFAFLAFALIAVTGLPARAFALAQECSEPCADEVETGHDTTDSEDSPEQPGGCSDEDAPGGGCPDEGAPGGCATCLCTCCVAIAIVADIQRPGLIAEIAIAPPGDVASQADVSPTGRVFRPPRLAA